MAPGALRDLLDPPSSRGGYHRSSPAYQPAEQPSRRASSCSARARAPLYHARGRRPAPATRRLVSVGVVVGVAAVAITGSERLEPVIGVAVAANIVRAGTRLVRRSAGGLMDRALDEPAQRASMRCWIPSALTGVQFHALRTREGGRRAMVSVHVLGPGAGRSSRATISPKSWRRRCGAGCLRDGVAHVEPAEDARSLADSGLDREPSS
jgi:hypothetical protein